MASSGILAGRLLSHRTRRLYIRQMRKWVSNSITSIGIQLKMQNKAVLIWKG